MRYLSIVWLMFINVPTYADYYSDTSKQRERDREYSYSSCISTCGDGGNSRCISYSVIGDTEGRTACEKMAKSEYRFCVERCKDNYK